MYQLNMMLIDGLQRERLLLTLKSTVEQQEVDGQYVCKIVITFVYYLQHVLSICDPIEALHSLGQMIVGRCFHLDSVRHHKTS